MDQLYGELLAFVAAAWGTFESFRRRSERDRRRELELDLRGIREGWSQERLRDEKRRAKIPGFK